MAKFSDTILNKDSYVPLYQQLKEMIQQEIESGKWQPNQLIPTEQEFMERFQVSRITIRQAIMDLVKEDVLYRQRGVGTFVAKPKIGLQYLNDIVSYDTQIINEGHNPSRKVLEKKVCHPGQEVLTAMELPQNSEVIKLSRLFFVDDEPHATVDSYLPCVFCETVLDRDMERESLYQILSERPETKVMTVQRTLDAKIASHEDQNIIGLEKWTPMLYIITKAMNKDGRVMEYGISHFRGDRNTFYVETHLE